MLIDVRAVEWDEQERRWRATKELHEVAIPDTLRGLIRPASTASRTMRARY